AGDDTAIGRTQLARFVAMWIGTTIISTWSVGVIDDYLGLKWAWLAKPGVELCLGVVGFLLSRHWVYRKGLAERRSRRDSRPSTATPTLIVTCQCAIFPPSTCPRVSSTSNQRMSRTLSEAFSIATRIASSLPVVDEPVSSRDL